MNFKPLRAWRIKAFLCDIVAAATNAKEAEPLLARWYSWVRRCRLEPMKQVAKILNAFDSQLTNGSVEAVNGRIQAAKAKVRTTAPSVI